MTDELVCWQCGSSLKAVPLPLGRRAECLACSAELHVCRLCRHYDTGKAKHCRERAAEEVRNKTRANFCDWFQPRPGAFKARAVDATDAAKPLDSLFGDSSPVKSNRDSRSELDKLFGKD